MHIVDIGLWQFELQISAIRIANISN